MVSEKRVAIATPWTYAGMGCEKAAGARLLCRVRSRVEGGEGEFGKEERGTGLQHTAKQQDHRQG